MKKKGFSLIELLVVATIIIVLTTIGLVSYQIANVRARDTKRKADLEQIRAALEMYRTENGLYPATKEALETDYIKDLPTDPKSYTYYYVRNVSTYAYTLDAYLEGGGTDTADNCGAPGDCNYRVENP